MTKLSYEQSYFGYYGRVEQKMKRVLTLLDKHKSVARERDFDWGVIADMANAEESLNNIIDDLETTVKDTWR